MRLVYRPLTSWPSPSGLTADRRPHDFSASWADTLSLLEREVDMIGEHGASTECVHEVAVRDRDLLRGDGGMRSNARLPEHPGVVVSFAAKRHGPLCYFTDRFDAGRVGRYVDDEFGGKRWETFTIPGWHANVRAVAKSLEALRLVERYGTANRGEQYTGWAQLGAGTPLGPPAPMTRDEAARVLLVGADMNTTPALVAEALDDAAFVAMLYRIAARQHHPDAGGSGDTFRKITEARDLLVSQPKGSTAC